MSFAVKFGSFALHWPTLRFSFKTNSHIPVIQKSEIFSLFKNHPPQSNLSLTDQRTKNKTKTPRIHDLIYEHHQHIFLRHSPLLKHQHMCRPKITHTVHSTPAACVLFCHKMMTTSEPTIMYSSSYLLPPQNELVEKFNAAFYEAQQQPPPQQEEKAKLPLDDEILESFDESYFTNIDAYENDFIDYTDLSESLDEVFGGVVDEDKQFSSFFVPPPFVEQLPPISSITRNNNTDFANFLRNMPCDSLDLFADVSLPNNSHARN